VVSVGNYGYCDGLQVFYDGFCKLIDLDDLLEVI
jgi:hypothetical protein